MLKLLFVAGIAVAALIPSLVLAQPACGQQGGQVANIIVDRDPDPMHAHRVPSTGADCAHAYGYYDRSDQWHANAINLADARGYYDRDGAWVVGPPNGYYNTAGRWIVGTDAAAGGYDDQRGRWVPSSANGYYDDAGHWVTSASGHYDNAGRWVAGQANGAYDVNGHWMAGAPNGHADAHGVWIADPQPGYYDEHHQWRAGSVRGYYDTRGGWIAQDAAGNVAHAEFQAGADHQGVDGRAAWLEHRIRSAADDGSLSSSDATHDLGRLNSIRSREAAMRDASGQLSPEDDQYLQQRLSRLSDALSAALAAS
jgi:hypothetical protein